LDIAHRGSPTITLTLARTGANAPAAGSKMAEDTGNLAA
jgi:hypothetical protein